jgi:hypothetical protein
MAAFSAAEMQLGRQMVVVVSAAFAFREIFGELSLVRRRCHVHSVVYAEFRPQNCKQLCTYDEVCVSFAV